MDPSVLLIAVLLGMWSPAQDLRFSEFFEPTPRSLQPSAKLLALDGHRVRLAGWMVLSEEPPLGEIGRAHV